MARERCFWVVSPNVRFDRITEPRWKDAIIRLRSAFMGWGSEEKQHGGIGYKFANQIQPGDVILVARRHLKQPELVGVGIVFGQFETYRESLKTPQEFGSRRKLRPFKPITHVPTGIPILSALNHIKALRQLHPENNENHRRVCSWMLRQLSLQEASEVRTGRYDSVTPLLRELHLGKELEYKVQGRKTAGTAIKAEAKLLIAYQRWLEQKGRVLHLARYGRLSCDAYEKEANNLIEAKRTARREYIRMAAGQLLDYAFAGRALFGTPHMAILLPKRPLRTSLGWLNEIGIHLIWKQGRAFRDDAEGQFT